MPTSPPIRAASCVEQVARIRPATAAALLGAVLGLGVGGAWLGGAAAKASTLRAQAVRIEGATAAGFTEEALAAAAGGLDASALAIARRHDPYMVAGPTRRDRQAELLTARLEQLRAGEADGSLRRISLVGATTEGFRHNTALDASRDLECLTQAAYYEARGEGRDGMRAVAQVVLNRVRHPAFPKTVCAVVFQGAGRRTGCQFSFTCDGSMRGGLNQSAWSRAREIASAALSGEVFSPVGKATHFHTTRVAPAWRNSLVRVGQVGDHLFYRFGGAGSRPTYPYPAQATAAKPPRIVQASLDPTSAVREAGAVAYNLLVAQENRMKPPETAPSQREPSPTTPEPQAIRQPGPAPEVATPTV